MTQTVELREYTRIDTYTKIEESNINMRRVWAIEKDMANLSIRHLLNDGSLKKTTQINELTEEIIYSMRDFLIYFMDLNPLEYNDYIMEKMSYFDLTNAVTTISSALLNVQPIKTDAAPIKDLNDYKNSLKERYFFLEQSIADFDYNEQQVMTNLHISPSDFEKENYYRMNEVLSALSPEERPMTGSGFLRQMNMTKENANEAMKSSRKE